MVVAYPPGLLIPCPVDRRCSAYLRHSSIVKLEPTRTPAAGAFCVCVFSFCVFTLLGTVSPSDTDFTWDAESARVADGNLISICSPRRSFWLFVLSIPWLLMSLFLSRLLTHTRV